MKNKLWGRLLLYIYLLHSQWYAYCKDYLNKLKRVQETGDLKEETNLFNPSTVLLIKVAALSSLP
jgi:hypothetical protein